MTGSLHRPAGSLAHDGDPVALYPQAAGWSLSGLRVLTLSAGVPRQVSTGDYELFVLPLTGGARVVAGGETFELTGRESVFTRVTDIAYVGRDTEVTLTSATDAQIALPMAKARHRLPPRYGPADAVPVETRGAGAATRQVTNFGAPGGWDHADRLMACELLTPPGNWSSYPQHKHDHTCAVDNEEIYYYRLAGPDGVTPSRRGFGLHRTYDDTVDEFVEVRDGDVCLVPHGYHGPCVAAPGYPMYYLNVLAGQGAERSMAFCDDPEHTWVRDSWRSQEIDQRCPMTSATGIVGSGIPS
ncbi:MAG: 5-deoxy-glucuronate isomerase [Mycobacteriales bacterium]